MSPENKSIIRTVLSFISIVLLTSVMISCSDPPRKSEIKPVYHKDLNYNEREIAEKAFIVFSDVCRPLMNDYSQDIESIVIENGFDRNQGMLGDGCLDYRCRDFGWDKQIYIKIKLKDAPHSVIPKEFKAWGQTLHFYLGGPKNPGYTVGKFPQLCGKTKSTNDLDFYILEPKLSFIK